VGLLAQEVMFFGGLFLAYIVYRNLYPEAFAHASQLLNVSLGATNTGVLLASSLTMALAVRAGRRATKLIQLGMLVLTTLLGLTFLVVKYFEYKAKFDHHLVPGPTFMTDPEHIGAFFQTTSRRDPARADLLLPLFRDDGRARRALVVGAAIMMWMFKRSKRGEFVPEHHDALEMSGLYWHFVDIVWIFLFPMLYLLGAHFGTFRATS
jgi:cytochrome c oxidase subunit 3